jgi:hypothetical protein
MPLGLFVFEKVTDFIVCICSDNPESDVLGANMFDRELQATLESRKTQAGRLKQQTMHTPSVCVSCLCVFLPVLQTEGHTGEIKLQTIDLPPEINKKSTTATTVHTPVTMESSLVDDGIYGVRKCYSMLVETGVFECALI